MIYSCHYGNLPIDMGKVLSPEILDDCHEYLLQRNNLNLLMKDCKQRAQKLEEALAKNDKVVKQPSSLSVELFDSIDNRNFFRERNELLLTATSHEELTLLTIIL